MSAQPARAESAHDARARLRALARTVRDDLGLRGPWGWFGNTRHGEPYLATRGGGRQYVIGPDNRHEHVTYTPHWDDIQTKKVADCGPSSCKHRDELGETVGERTNVDGSHTVAHDRPTLAVRVLDDRGYARLKPAHEVAIYEVCPEATSETDKRVYRHDIIGLRSPVADYLAALDADTVLELIDDYERLRSLLARMRDSHQNLIDYTNDPGTDALSAQWEARQESLGKAEPTLLVELRQTLADLLDDVEGGAFTCDHPGDCACSFARAHRLLNPAEAAA